MSLKLLFFAVIKSEAQDRKTFFLLPGNEREHCSCGQTGGRQVASYTQLPASPPGFLAEKAAGRRVSWVWGGGTKIVNNKHYIIPVYHRG
jgi:hypothetical protein